MAATGHSRRLPDNGLAAWAVVKERGYEGLVAKGDESVYRGGQRGARHSMTSDFRRGGPVEVTAAKFDGPAARSGLSRARIELGACLSGETRALLEKNFLDRTMH